MRGRPSILPAMHRSQGAWPRARSSFAAAFLSLLFPGLGHAYAGAWERALGFAAAPLLLLALRAGLGLALGLDLLGFVLQPWVLTLILVVNVVALLYRLVAIVDAWRVARFLNASEAMGGGRLGPPRLAANPLSVAGLIAVVLVMAGGHVAVAYYDLQAYDLVNCVFDNGNATCDSPDSSPSPAASDSGATTTSLTPNFFCASISSPARSAISRLRLMRTSFIERASAKSRTTVMRPIPSASAMALCVISST